MDYFDDFKPIRNKFRSLHLDTVFERIHLLAGRKQLLPEMAEFLYVNAIAYCGTPRVSGKQDRVFNDVLQLSVSLKEKVYSANIDRTVWRWLHTLMLNQLKAHFHDYTDSTYRYYSIFSAPEIKQHIERHIGMGYAEYLKCALWLHAVFTKKLKVPKTYFINQKNEGTSFSAGNMTKTLALLSLPLKALRDRLKQSIAYDDDMFIFHGYPHLEYPIIESDEYLYCLFPAHLHAQLLAGIYYITKIYEPEYKLANPFGKSFEKYVGSILNKNNNSHRFGISEEIPFEYKGNKLKTSDWIVSSSDVIVFIECKTKRLRIASKTLASFSKTLDEDVDFIAKGLLQLYKVIDHYIEGNIPGLPFDAHKAIIPILLTFEEGFVGGPDIKEKINLAIKNLLEQAQLSPEVLNKWPYHCYSIDKFEVDSQIMFDVGFVEFFAMQQRGELDESFIKSFSFKDYHEAEFAETFLCP